MAGAKVADAKVAVAAMVEAKAAVTGEGLAEARVEARAAVKEA